MRHPAMMMKNNAMDYTKNILPILWKFLEKRKNCSISINISTIDGELVVSIIDGFKIKRFKSICSLLLKENLGAYLKV